MTVSHKRRVQLRIVFPVALTRLYFNVLDLSASPHMHHIDYFCCFEDDPIKAQQGRPDIIVSLHHEPAPKTCQARAAINVPCISVASPKLLAQHYIARPRHLEALPYATRDRKKDSAFFVTAPSGDVMVVDPRRKFDACDLFAAHEAVKHGIAFAVLPKFLVEDDIETGTLIPLCQAYAPSNFHISLRISPECQHLRPARLMSGLIYEKLRLMPGLRPKD